MLAYGQPLAVLQRVVGMVIPLEHGQVLTVSEHGYGKRTDVSEFPAKGRGSQGVIGMQTTERKGPRVGAAQVFDGEEIMLSSELGSLTVSTWPFSSVW